MSLPFYLFILRHPVKKQSVADTYLPNSLFDTLPSAGTSDKTSQIRTGSKIENDWRHGSIQIDWLDIHELDEMDTLSKSRSKHSRVSLECWVYSLTGNGNPTAQLNLSNRTIKTGSIELPEGVVHIFRERITCANHIENPAINDGSTADGVLLAVLSVPPHMSPSDFLNFVAPAAEGITHLRMIRYTLLLIFAAAV